MMIETALDSDFSYAIDLFPYILIWRPFKRHSAWNMLHNTIFKYFHMRLLCAKQTKWYNDITVDELVLTVNLNQINWRQNNFDIGADYS